jgi:cytochrome c peroxidase
MLKSRASKSAVFVLALFGCSTNDNQAVEPELGQVKQALNFTTASLTCSEDTRVQLGIVTQDECVGAELFFRDEFGGNGRSCASCHPAANNYTIDPTFIAQLPASDPLFVAEQGDPLLAGLERPDLMRNHGLILENVDGAESPTTKFTMRSVPHCFGLSKSIQAPAGPGPQERTGWSGDGAPGLGRLKDFQTGAIFQHYTQSLDREEGEDFIQADEAELSAIDAFLKTIGRTNDLDLALVSLSDAGAQAGRGTFMEPAKRCNVCHNNAGANLASGINQNFDTGVETVRLGILDVQGIPFDGGFGGQGLLAFNFDADGDGTNDSFGNGAFNTPPLVEAADTGPFFHTNAFNTIEEAVAFYRTAAFNDSPAGAFGAISMTNTEVANIGRFLRVLNAAMNVQMALARIDAVLPVIDEDHNQSREMQQELLKLARVEAEDALQVLSGVSALNASAQSNLTSALAFLQTASTHASHTQRQSNAQSARAQLVTANASLGTGMTFVMGGGTFLF